MANNGSAARNAMTEMHTQFWHSMPCNDGIDTVKLSLPNVLQVLDGTDKKQSVTTSAFVTEQANELTVEKVPRL